METKLVDILHYNWLTFILQLKFPREFFFFRMRTTEMKWCVGIGGVVVCMSHLGLPLLYH